MQDAPAGDAPIALQVSRALVIRALRPVTGAGHRQRQDPRQHAPGMCGLSYGELDVKRTPLLVEASDTASWRIYWESALASHNGMFHGQPSAVTVDLTDGSWLHAPLSEAALGGQEIVVQLWPRARSPAASCSAAPAGRSSARR